MPKASIVVRAYNEEKHIGKLLYGLSQQDYEDFEVILVDSGSTDNTVKIAEQHDVRLVHIAKKDFSFGRALNLGCEAAEGDYLVFVSAHVYPVTTTWLTNLVAPFDDPKITVSYGKQRAGEVNKYSEARLMESWFPEQSQIPQEGYFCNNANCAVRKKDWLTHKYDEALTGLEDIDWAKQSVARGGLVAYAASAGIIHVHEETWPQVRNRYQREAIAIKLIEGDRAMLGFSDVIPLFSKHCFKDMRVAFEEGCLFDKWPEIIRFRFNQLWGTYEGSRYSTDEVEKLRRRLYYPASSPDRPSDAREWKDAIDYSAWN